MSLRGDTRYMAKVSDDMAKGSDDMAGSDATIACGGKVPRQSALLTSTEGKSWKKLKVHKKAGVFSQVFRLMKNNASATVPGPPPRPPFLERLRVHVGGATSLYGLDLDGKSDPYVKIFWGSTIVGTTQVRQNDANPIWNRLFEFEVDVRTAREEVLLFEVWDENWAPFGKAGSNDALLGVTSVPGAKIFHKVSRTRVMYS